MHISSEIPLDRARAKLAQIERDLNKCPDFQLYLVTESPQKRARMKRMLMEIPKFRLWGMLADYVERAGPRCGALISQTAPEQSR